MCLYLSWSNCQASTHKTDLSPYIYFVKIRQASSTGQESFLLVAIILSQMTSWFHIKIYFHAPHAPQVVIRIEFL